MAVVTYLYFLSKFTEFADTLFFMVRKKFAHVSMLQVITRVAGRQPGHFFSPLPLPYLQVIHHGVMPFYSWALVRWLPGGHETFGGTVNSLVHVIMYSYYFLAALGPHMQKYLWWKKYLTTFQMVQVPRHPNLKIISQLPAGDLAPC